MNLEFGVDHAQYYFQYQNFNHSFCCSDHSTAVEILTASFRIITNPNQ